MWTTLVNSLQSIIEWLYNFVGNYGLSVILFTILIRLFLLPLDLKAKASTRDIARINPEIQKINEKYKNNPEKKNKKIMELYQKHQINPFGGCLPMLLQMPLMFAMFGALRSIANIQLQEFYIELIQYSDSTIAPLLNDFVANIENSTAIKQSVGTILSSLFANPDNGKLIAQLGEVVGDSNIASLVETIKNINVNEAMDLINSSQSGMSFFWIKNVWVADSPLRDIMGGQISFMQGGLYGYWNGLFILSGLAWLTSYIQMKLATPPGDNQQAQSMGLIMPLMSVVFTATNTSTFGLYWITTNIFLIVQQLIYNRINPDEQTGKEGVKP